MNMAIDQCAASWPDSSFERVTFCPVCASSNRSILHEAVTDLAFGAAPGLWDMQLCLQCNSAYLDPRPDSKSISLAYQNYYTHVGQKAHERWWKIAKRALRDDYFVASIGWKGGRTLWPGRYLIRLFPLSRIGLDTLIARNLRKLPAPGSLMLDVGCGNGSFLAFARQAGWVVRGLDFDAQAVFAARELGLDVLEGGIEILVDESNKYDRINLSHVLEHVYEPREILQHCFRLLKPGGVLWIDTPNIQSVGHRVFGKAWRGLEAPRHLQIFSRPALMVLLEQIGFSAIEDRLNFLGIKLMWNESRGLLKKCEVPEEMKHGVCGRIYSELCSLVSPNRREFVTLVCKKPA